MGRPNASSKQQFQSVSQSSAEAIDDRTSVFVDEKQQESAGNEQLEVSRDQNGQNNQQPHQATTAMAFPPHNYQMRSPIAGADPQAFPPQPQAFPLSQDEPQSFFPPKPQAFPLSQEEPQVFPPSQEEPQAFPPSQEEPQAFPPSQEEPQAFPPSQDESQSFFPPPQPQAFPPIQEEPQAFPSSQQGKPQEFPPKVDDHHHHQPQAFPPAPDEPQAFPPRYDYHQPQAFPPAQDDPQPFPPPEASQNPQALPPQQAAFQQQQNGMQFPQNANFFHPSTMGGGQMGAQSTMPASPFHPTSQSMINNPTPGFSVINQNPIIQVPTENWKSGLFECMKDPTNALVTACFPCVTFGQIAEIIDSGQTSCGTSGLLYGTIAFCIAMPCLMSCTYRTKLRSRYGLIETPAPDWIIHCFCECCALCQEYREVKERGLDPSIGWIGNVAKQKQMVQNAAMTPPMKQTMIG